LLVAAVVVVVVNKRVQVAVVLVEFYLALDILSDLIL
jgi:hypothetical protein